VRLFQLFCHFEVAECPVGGSKKDLNADVKVNKQLTLELRCRNNNKVSSIIIIIIIIIIISYHFYAAYLHLYT
jgi:hypothetical protein